MLLEFFHLQHELVQLGLWRVTASVKKYSKVFLYFTNDKRTCTQQTAMQDSKSTVMQARY